jgi:prepilin-type N-terminal cleavage/methylation domain-containing protein
MRDQRGCSLIEVLVATTILAVGVASLAQLFTVAVVSNIAAMHQTRGAMLAAAKVEELRSLPWGAELQAGDADVVGEFARRWSVEPLGAYPNVAAVVDVRVSWNQLQVGRVVTVKARVSR